MRLADTLPLALRNLREAKLRTALTVARRRHRHRVARRHGVVRRGDAGPGARQPAPVGRVRFDHRDRRAARSAASAGAAAATPAERARGAPRAARQAGPRVPLDDAALKTFAAIPGVKEVVPGRPRPGRGVLRRLLRVHRRDRRPDVVARARASSSEFSFGRFFANETDDACLLSLEFAQAVTDGTPESLVGKDITLGYAAAADARRQPDDRRAARHQPPAQRTQVPRRRHRRAAGGAEPGRRDVRGRDDPAREGAGDGRRRPLGRRR